MQKKTIITTAVITFIVTVVTIFTVLFCFFGDTVKTVLTKNLIDKYYIESSDTDTLLSGMVSSLGDPYSVYFNDEDYKSFMATITSEYIGIGIEAYVSEDGYFTVMTVFEDSPAQAAGIMSNDKIIEVDGQKATADNFQAIVSYIKGADEKSKDLSEITVTILRGEEKLSLNVIRDTIELDTVTSKDYGNAKYIRLSSFSQNTFSELKNTLADIGDKYIILDVRDNPGGLLSSAVDIADMFLGEADIVYTQDNAEKKKYFKSDSECIENPLIVLCNESSASASEVLTAALSDNNRATLIGEKTFGKGCVQELFPMPKGGALKLTTAYYYTPGGVCIHGVGITPDEVVALPEAVKDKSIALLTPEEDTQLTRALELAK